MNTPPKRKRGAELSVGRRTAMAVEIALAIPPGKTRVPKGILAPWRSGTVLVLDTPKNIGPSVKLRSTRPGSQFDRRVGGDYLPTVRGVR